VLVGTIGDGNRTIAKLGTSRSRQRIAGLRLQDHASPLSADLRRIRTRAGLHTARVGRATSGGLARRAREIMRLRKAGPGGRASRNHSIQIAAQGPGARIAIPGTIIGTLNDHAAI